MELVISACVTLLGEFYKKMVAKLGQKKLDAWVLLISFVLSVLGYGGYEYFGNGIQVTDLKELAQVFLSAVGFYEVVLKRAIMPFLDKLHKFITE